MYGTRGGIPDKTARLPDGGDPPQPGRPSGHSACFTFCLGFGSSNRQRGILSSSVTILLHRKPPSFPWSKATLFRLTILCLRLAAREDSLLRVLPSEAELWVKIQDVTRLQANIGGALAKVLPASRAPGLGKRRTPSTASKASCSLKPRCTSTSPPLAFFRWENLVRGSYPPRVLAAFEPGVAFSLSASPSDQDANFRLFLSSDEVKRIGEILVSF